MNGLKAFSELLLLCFFLLYLPYHVSAQHLVEYPLDNNPVILKYIETVADNHSRNSQSCVPDTLPMPFFEDFSGSDDIYPDCNKWQDNHVFVNFDMAFKPPSVGVATFEGLSPDGTPYNTSASVGMGSPADTLTSQHIDLSGKTAADAIYLSFFYQKQGLSDRPEERDSFFLEFKDSNDVWISVWAVPGVADSVSTLVIPEFNQQYIAVDSGFYLYNGFQFRYRNLASVSGNNDHWHLDYIILDESRANNADSLNPNYGRHPDVTFTQRPTTPLKNNYSSMPWRHFTGPSCWADSVLIYNFNHNDVSGIATLDREYEVEEISPASTSLIVEGIPAIPSYFPSANSDDSLRHELAGTFHSSFNPTEKTTIRSTYKILSPGGFQSNPVFFFNDTVSTNTVLDNYFAYDDGTAETRVIAQGLGTKVAVEFTSEIKDTLQGIYFHLPYFTNRDAQLDFINVKVWLDSLTGPEAFSRDLFHLQYANGFNGFYFVELLDFSGDKVLVHLEPGQKFYVGWQQSFGPEVPVGFDRSTDARSKTFIGTGSSWDTMSIKGSVMIRPLLWGGADFTLIPVDNIENPSLELLVYPNPTEGILNLKLSDDDSDSEYSLIIYNTMGQEVFSGEFVEQINLYNLEKGLYLLSLMNDKGIPVVNKKLIKF